MHGTRYLPLGVFYVPVESTAMTGNGYRYQVQCENESPPSTTTTTTISSTVTITTPTILVVTTTSMPVTNPLSSNSGGASAGSQLPTILAAVFGTLLAIGMVTFAVFFIKLRAPRDGATTLVNGGNDGERAWTQSNAAYEDADDDVNDDAQLLFPL